jgi:hypothetical protein
MSEEHMYIIGVGGTADFEAGRGALYFTEARTGEHCIPVWTTPEGASRYIEANLNTPEAYMEMLESAPLTHTEALAEGRFSVIPVDEDLLIEAALANGIDILVRDPRPGHVQEILRLDE